MSYLSAAAAAAKSTPFIDWASLGQVAGVSFVFGVAIVVLFSVGIVGLSWVHGVAVADAETSNASGSRGLGFALSGTCFALCAAAVLYGLYLIIPQFHK